MIRSNLLQKSFGLLTIFGLASLSTSQEPALLPKNDAGLQDPIEVQTRGPLHEAYAQPFDSKPEPGPIVPKAPPPNIPEEPPEEHPDAANAQWIPGYWSWDLQRKDFLWVSGVYRVPPQNRTFIPGYWTNSPEGWRWVSGFWSNTQQQEVPYTPEPPAPLDNGPQFPAPDDNSTYIPGVWVYRDSRFIWRPGYWAMYQDSRVWVPPHYIWTPNGYLFVDGYWDLPFESRGLIYAPVYFHRPLWLSSGWCYRPGFVLGFSGFFDSCFVGRSGGFYFGNYYDPFYARNGYRPWYAGRGCYDPAFTQYAFRNQQSDPNWYAGVQQSYVGRSSGRIAAPPLTFAQQKNFVAAQSAAPVVMPANQFTSNQVKIVKASPAQLRTQQALAQKTREIAATRQRVETVNAAVVSKTVEPRALKVQNLTNPKSSSGPTIITQTQDTRPGVVQPKQSSTGPKTINATPNVPPAPKTINKQPAPTPTPTPAPKVNNAPPAAPKNVQPAPPPTKATPAPAPPVNPAPAPRASPAPAPPVNPAPAPRASPAPAPRANSAPAPRANPAPAPRANPAPAPRANPAPAPRVSEPPRSSPPPQSSPPARRK